MDDAEHKLWGFTFTLGYSRTLMAEGALDQKLGTLLRLHEEAWRCIAVQNESPVTEFHQGNISTQPEHH